MTFMLGRNRNRTGQIFCGTHLVVRRYLCHVPGKWRVTQSSGECDKITRLLFMEALIQIYSFLLMLARLPLPEFQLALGGMQAVGFYSVLLESNAPRVMRSYWTLLPDVPEIILTGIYCSSGR